MQHLSHTLGLEVVRGAISDSRLEQLQSFLYIALSQNSGMVYKNSNLNVFDIFTINFRAVVIEEIQRVLNGYDIDGQDSFLSLANRG